mmetsp:Transcript_57166/g.107234  ORF Transcript_57166/g.107234 Transcript_57166/m.107234 type:complete len:80 (-) Transcript_57166:218-457(-)
MPDNLSASRNGSNLASNGQLRRPRARSQDKAIRTKTAREAIPIGAEDRVARAKKVHSKKEGNVVGGDGEGVPWADKRHL